MDWAQPFSEKQQSKKDKAVAKKTATKAKRGRALYGMKAKLVEASTRVNRVGFQCRKAHTLVRGYGLLVGEAGRVGSVFGGSFLKGRSRARNDRAPQSTPRSGPDPRAANGGIGPGRFFWD